MPRRAGRACAKRGCAGIVRDGVCSVCGPRSAVTNYDERRGSAASRGYDRHWQKRRLAYLREHPLCVECAREDIVTAATDVDHIIPKRDGGTDDPENLQALCHVCHSKKTASGG